MRDNKFEVGDIVITPKDYNRQKAIIISIYDYSFGESINVTAYVTATFKPNEGFNIGIWYEKDLEYSGKSYPELIDILKEITKHEI